jgi:hypothetical protein
MENDMKLSNVTQHRAAFMSPFAKQKVSEKWNEFTETKFF